MSRPETITLANGPICFTDATNSGIVDEQGVGTIKDNDGPSSSPTFQFSSKFVSVSEGAGSLSVTVTRSGPTTAPASIDYSTGPIPNGGASDRADYTLALGTLDFGVGETSKTIKILLTDDSAVEGNEVFFVNLSNPSTGITIGLPNQAVVTISDNDVLPPTSNPIDSSSLFVQQHYHDFLNREPDASGFSGYNFWLTKLDQFGGNFVTAEMVKAFISSSEYRERIGPQN